MSIMQCIMTDISEVMAFLPEATRVGAVYGVLLIAVCLAVGELRYRRDIRSADEKKSAGICRRWPLEPGHGIGSILFVIYFLILVQTVFLCREPGSRWGTDMQLLGTWGTTMQDHAWVLENVLLFIPFGILLPASLPGKLHYLTVPLGLVCSAGIEYTQLRTGRGFCQLDDVVMNTLGALAGYLIWLLLRLLARAGSRLWNRKSLRRRICLVAAFLWMVVIFLFSAQPADESTQTSLRVERAICSVTIPGYLGKTPEEQTALAQKIEFPVRKGAHMTEYAILTVFLLGVLGDIRITKQQFARAVLITAAYASMDEFHQLFVPGRSGQLRDVLIDSAGAVIGGLLFTLLLICVNMDRQERGGR